MNQRHTYISEIQSLKRITLCGTTQSKWFGDLTQHRLGAFVPLRSTANSQTWGYTFFPTRQPRELEKLQTQQQTNANYSSNQINQDMANHHHDLLHTPQTDPPSSHPHPSTSLSHHHAHDGNNARSSCSSAPDHHSRRTHTHTEQAPDE